MAKSEDRSNFYTVSQIGKTREMTPEGYLLCREVAVARTGEMLYGAGEVPIEDSAGLIIINRGETELFKAETLASFEGKAVTNDHPDDWVNPKNWKELAVGVCSNVRRGEGVEDYLMLADLLITDEQAISDVLKGKIEISLGYDADYTQTAIGHGLQTNIIGNHIALVDKGRCGARCAIGDSKTMSTKNPATKPKKPSLAERIRLAWRSKDAAAAEQAAKDAEELEKTNDGKGEDDPEPEGDEDGKTGDAILKAIKAMDAKYDKRFKQMEKRFKDAEPDPTNNDDLEPDPTADDILEAEKAEKLSEAGTKTYTGDSLQEVLSRAEILSPGIKLPTLDAKSKDVVKVVQQCKCNALTNAYATEDGRKGFIK